MAAGLPTSLTKFNSLSLDVLVDIGDGQKLGDDDGGGSSPILSGHLDGHGGGQGLADARISCGLLCRTYSPASYRLLGCCRSTKNLGLKLPTCRVRGCRDVVGHQHGRAEVEPDGLGVGVGGGAASRLDT